MRVGFFHFSFNRVAAILYEITVSPRSFRHAELPPRTRQFFLRERYRKSELSYSKARAITRIATPDTEEYLLMIARHGTAAHVEGLVSKYRRCKRVSYLAHAPQSASGADRDQVVVHVSAETLRADSGAPDVSAETSALRTSANRVSAETSHPFQTDLYHLEDGLHVSAETARRLSCDASKVEVTFH